MIRISEYDLYNYYRFYTIQEIHSFNHIYHSLRISEDWLKNIIFDHNLAHLSLRDNMIYKRIMIKIFSYEAFNSQAQDRFEYEVI